MSAFIFALPVGLLCLLVIWFAWQLRCEQKRAEQWRTLAKDWEAAHTHLLVSLESVARPEQGKE